MSLKNGKQKYWLFDIIGAFCFGIGDWLLGYVDPGIVNESFSVIKAGHCPAAARCICPAVFFTGAIVMFTALLLGWKKHVSEREV